MSRPPRNRELERLVIDVLRATPIDGPERREAWQVYADWLLGHGELVGEWLAASLRADDAGEAAAPIRARLGEIARATRFRLVDLELADLSEVPELSRIADLTWERGFITQAAFRCGEFRAWDTSLLGHTPDRLVEVVLRSPSACTLHHLVLDQVDFVAEGSRYVDFGDLLGALDEPLPLRSLRLAGGEGTLRLDPNLFAPMPELRELSLGPFVPARRVGGELYQSTWSVKRQVHPDRDERERTRRDFTEILAEQLAEQLPALERLEFLRPGEGDAFVSALLRSASLGRLRRVRIGHLTQIGAATLIAGRGKLAAVEQVELVDLDGVAGPQLDQLRELGWLAAGPGRAARQTPL